MGYQALLFCPDEKLARVVSQVFTELDFSLDLVREPFAAVKKLMTQRFDAIVVDCENEQNASLLFKSARNSNSNQSSLAIAVVEGQAGVAKAYRIGANLVLTKPINVEQAKGTLRVARGLLRKNSDAANSAAAAPPVKAAAATSDSSSSSSQVTIQNDAPAAIPERRELRESLHADFEEFEAPLNTPAQVEITSEVHPDARAMSASAHVNESPAFSAAPASHTDVAGPAERVAEAPAAVTAPAIAAPVKPGFIGEIVKNGDPVRPTLNGFPSEMFAGHASSNTPVSASSGSAAATAPAKEVSTHSEMRSKAAELEPLSPSFSGPTSGHSSGLGSGPTFGSSMTSSAPSFSALGEEAEESGSKKKILIAVAAIGLIAVVGYFAYGMFANKSGASSVSSVAPHSVAARPSSTPAATATAPAAATGSSGSNLEPADSAQSAPNTTSAAIAEPPAAAGKVPVIRLEASPEPAVKKPEAPAIIVKNGVGKSATTTRKPAQAQGDDSAPVLTGQLAEATPNENKLSGLMPAESSIAKPTLATVRLSQGVSQGMLIKRVQPKYPQMALAAHTQGAVQIEATINKEGAVTNVTVLSGDPILSRAAVEAVRQWRYKPYYLDGNPVEVQTQVTVNFKAN